MLVWRSLLVVLLSRQKLELQRLLDSSRFLRL
jgi:hypothetical protein